MQDVSARQCVSTVMMVRPCSFGYNVDAAQSNAFMHEEDKESSKINGLAEKEFDNLVSKLRAEGVEVYVFQDTLVTHTPDSIFPNNWFDTDSEGMAILYPMCPENRRLEREKNFLQDLTKYGFVINKYTDLTSYEKKGKFLEGTGSLVFDCISKVAYTCLSPRTHRDLIPEFEKYTGYTTVKFYAYDKNGAPIYHTNVIMAIGDKFAVLCPEAIRSGEERARVLESLRNTGREIIEISPDQVEQFCGNILQIRNIYGGLLIVMSETAYNGFTIEQKNALGRFGKLIYAPIPTIEYYGGGSVRCMIAEIFLPRVEKQRTIKVPKKTMIEKSKSLISTASQSPPLA